MLFASVLVTTGSVRWNLQPIHIAQIVQLLQGGAFIRVITRRFAVFPCTVKNVEEIQGDGPLHQDSLAALHKSISSAVGMLTAPFCEEEQEHSPRLIMK